MTADSSARQPRVSACIVCRNEADRLEACLRSVAWADEVVVMDLASSDGSADVAARLGARVVRRDPAPFVELVRNEIAAQATGEWILVVDPDERVSEGLADELRRVRHRTDVDVVLVPRTNLDLGAIPSNPLHRYEFQPRMYRASTITWPEQIHALPSTTEDRVLRLDARDELVLVHERSRSVAEILDRVIRYAPAEAERMLASGQGFTASAMIGDLVVRSHKQLVLGRAWDDGVPGVLRALLLVSSRVYTWVALWQLSGSPRTERDDRLLRRVGALLVAGAGIARAVLAPYRLVKKLRRSH